MDERKRKKHRETYYILQLTLGRQNHISCIRRHVPASSLDADYFNYTENGKNDLNLCHVVLLRKIKKSVVDSIGFSEPLDATFYHYPEKSNGLNKNDIQEKVSVMGCRMRIEIYVSWEQCSALYGKSCEAAQCPCDGYFYHYYIPKKILIHFALEQPCNIFCTLHGVKCILHGVKESRSPELLCFEWRKFWQPSCRRQQWTNE